MGLFSSSDSPEEKVVEQQLKIEEIMENMFETMEAFDEEFLEQVKESQSEKAFRNAATSLNNMIIRFEEDRIRKVEEHVGNLRTKIGKIDEDKNPELMRITRNNLNDIGETVENVKDEVRRLKRIHSEAKDKWNEGNKKEAIIEMEKVTGEDLQRLERIREEFWEKWTSPS